MRFTDTRVPIDAATKIPAESPGVQKGYVLPADIAAGIPVDTLAIAQTTGLTLALSGLQDNIDDIGPVLTDLQDQLDALPTTYSPISDFTALDGRVDQHDTDISDLNDAVTAVEGDVSSLSGRVTTAENNITTLLISNQYREVAVDYLVIANDKTINCTAPLTVTLPAAVAGKVYTIKNTSNSICNVIAHTGEYIDNVPTAALTSFASITIQGTSYNSWILI